MTIQILNTEYSWNWLATLNHFLSGLSWGAGLCLAFLVFVLFVNRYGKEKK